MTKASLTKRVETLEHHHGDKLKPVKLINVNHKNYLEKEKEIEQAEAAGFHVISLCSVAALNSKPHPDHVDYHRWLGRNKAKDDPRRLQKDE